jgi:hypothetical protein
MTGRWAGDAVNPTLAADPTFADPAPAADPTFADPALPASKDPTAP